MKKIRLANLFDYLLQRFPLRFSLFWLIVACAVALAIGFFPRAGLTRPVAAAQQGGNALWQDIDDAPLRGLDRWIVPRSYRALRLDQAALRQLLSKAPPEFSGKNAPVELSLPLPDGKFARFRVADSPIMEPGLAAQFPDIKTYSGQGIDDPAMTARFDWTVTGFHAMILSGKGAGTVYIDPYARGNTENYISYHKRDYLKADTSWRCLVTDEDVPAEAPGQPFVSNGQTLRTYRLAVAATGEYTTFHGGTVAQAFAAITTTINRVNSIYRRDVGINLVLIAGETSIIYANAATDPYTNGNPNTMINQNQTNIDSVIGTGNYDLGHVFGTNSGGLAGTGSCLSASKARGVTGSGAPVGDAFDVDYVAHEMGHQLSASHTFNGTVTNCASPNRSAGAAYEPGSGSTIMAYAGICGSQNLQPNSDDYFHVKSVEQIVAYITSGSGSGCGTATNTGNTPPTVSAGSSYTVPRNTPFRLTASGSDPNGDALTFCWEQYNLGTASPPDTDDGSRPIFRSYDPIGSPTRLFPSLTYILNNANTPPTTVGGLATGEAQATSTRTMSFQVTARDNRANGGGINSATAQISVNSGSGPFVITQPNTAVSWTGGSTQTVAWNVASTNLSPINCANVEISLSTDGGSTFPNILLASTANDGSQTVTVPNLSTATARIKVEAVGNVFFDVSDANFSITGGAICPTASGFSPPSGAIGSSVTINGTNLTGVSVRFSNNVNATITGNTGTQLIATVPVGAVTGPITLGKTGCADVQTGSFTVTTANPCANPSPITVGQTATGQLSAGDCVLNDGSLADLYSFSGTAGQQIAINLNSSAFDAYLLLANPSGIIIADDDDGGGGTNARIPAGSGFLTLPASGTYIVYANSLTAGQTGGYSLTLGGPANGGLQFYPLSSPVRLLDTRPGASLNACSQPNAPIASGTARTQLARNFCGIPAGAQAITGNVTTVNSGGGYLTLYPSGATQPTIASTNYLPNQIINNVFTVGLGASDGAFKIFALNTTDVVVDVSGYYAPPGTGGLYFHPLPAPVRLLETRPGEPVGCFKPGLPIPGNSALLVPGNNTCGIPASAQALVGNGTSVFPGSGGYLSLYPNGASQPFVATSNYGGGDVINGPFTVGLGTGGIFKIYTSATTHVVIDILGYYSADANDANGAGLLFNPLAHPVRLLETRTNPPNLTGCIKPGFRLESSVVYSLAPRGVCDSLTIPNAALALVGNATVVSPDNNGYLTFWPNNAAQPFIATSNYLAGQVNNRHFIVGMDAAEGKFLIFFFLGGPPFATDLVIDVSGYFAP